MHTGRLGGPSCQRPQSSTSNSNGRNYHAKSSSSVGNANNSANATHCNNNDNDDDAATTTTVTTSGHKSHAYVRARFDAGGVCEFGQTGAPQLTGDDTPHA